MLIRADRGKAASGHDPANELLHTLPGRLGIRAAVALLEKRPFQPLRRSHRAAAAKLGVAEAVDEVRGTDQEVQIEGPVLAVFEGAEAVEDEWFRGGLLRSLLLMEEQAVSTEPLGLALEGAVGDTEFAADLAQAGPADEAMKEGDQKVGASQPVAGGEGL
jgi:hypothetical protein